MTGQLLKSHFPLASCSDSEHVVAVVSDSPSDTSPWKSPGSTEWAISGEEENFWQFLGRKKNDPENHQCFASPLPAPGDGKKEMVWNVIIYFLMGQPLPLRDQIFLFFFQKKTRGWFRQQDVTRKFESSKTTWEHFSKCKPLIRVAQSRVKRISKV